MIQQAITRSELATELKEEEIRTSRVIFFSMAISIAIFVVVVLWYAGTVDQAKSTTEKAGGMDILTIAVIVVFVLLTSLGNTLVSTAFSVQRMMARISQQGGIGSLALMMRSPAQRLIAVVRTRSVIRLAFYEAAALFGLVVAYFKAVQGRLAFDGTSVIYFLPAASAILFIFRNLPNRERILKDCEPILEN